MAKKKQKTNRVAKDFNFALITASKFDVLLS